MPKKKSLTNTQSVNALIKELRDTPFECGMAILRERLLQNAKDSLKSMEKNPEAWENPIFSVGMYKDYCARVIKHLEFE